MFREIYERIDAGLCVIEMKFDGDGNAQDYRFVEVNQSFAEQSGIENAQGRWMRDIAPDHEQYWFDLYGNVAKTGTSIKVENRADALNRWFEAQAFRVGETDANLVAVFFRDITERKLTELSLRDSELQFRTLAEAMPNHVWTADTNGMLDWINPRIVAYSGVKAEALLGEKWATIVHPDDLDAAGARWAEAIKTGKGYETEFRLRRRDGAYRWHLTRAVAVMTEHGKVVRWVGTNTDIHEQRETTEALKETATRLRLAQQAGAIGSLEIDLKSQEVIGSDMFWDLWGLQKCDRLPMSDLQAVVLPSDHHLLDQRCDISETEQNTKETAVAFRIQRPSDGKVRWLALRCA